MKTETLAAEAVLLAIEDSVVNGHSQGIHFDSWDHVFSDGGPLFDAFIDYEAFEPFTGADLPTRKLFQLVYETYPQGSMFLVGCLQLRRFYKQYKATNSFHPHKQLSQCALNRSTHSGTC